MSKIIEDNIRRCKSCGIEKELNEDNFSIRKDKNICSFRYECKVCRVIASTRYNKEHKLGRKIYCKKYYADNKSKDNLRSKIYRKEHAVQIRKYYREHVKQRRQIDLSFKIKFDISTLIRRALKKNNSSKCGNSCFKYIDYTMKELKQHLERQFEPWMSWDNHGRYNPNTWNDLDPNTWTWQIDHIIPQSDLPYVNMWDDNFKKCWSLDNLRPYSAKQNILDGTNKIRHMAC